jgi:hypothetical protein
MSIVLAHGSLLGVCSCGTVTSLTAEEAKMAVVTKRVCDIPGCKNEINDGKERYVYMKVNGDDFEIGTPGPDTCDRCIERIKESFKAAISKVPRTVQKKRETKGDANVSPAQNSTVCTGE